MALTQHHRLRYPFVVRRFVVNFTSTYAYGVILLYQIVIMALQQ